MAFGSFYTGKRVLVTGDTGFKGSWLCEWLLMLGAEVHGIGLEPDTDPSIFETMGLRDRIRHQTIDIRDRTAIHTAVAELQPEVVFHLAAQSLVRRSYIEPLDTLESNVIGAANVLSAIQHAARDHDSSCAVVVVTSDKCYENNETGEAFRETDPMGGADLYSASKGATELVVSAWRSSFLGETNVSVATCRAGNVVGGGDWAEDRIVPDCVRSLRSGATVSVRSPVSVRPWQHVLEPLCGYLVVGSRVQTTPAVASAWNFGPNPESHKTVGELAETVVANWGSGEWKAEPAADGMHEAILLNLSIEKAINDLGWRPVWDFASTVETTIDWYRDVAEWSPADTAEYTRNQIARYQRDAESLGLPWAIS
ncbi:MAG: CDP-glucose 4,6-dehydratase [Acidimicrobiia bacterium]|nr:CDP-glucose 4,6-dehydratase [Acidimicrobiia bacterium]MDX2468011.1 CDP-glucose 4,6-dehydratase [Acidimicrobiia bacterium]